MKKTLMIAFAIVIGVIAIGAMTFGSVYNQLVKSDEAVKSAWSQVENVYQRRLDLIPNLVETVKGYAAHERQTLEGVVNARSKIAQMNISPAIVNDPNMLAKFQKKKLVVIERYPELKANQNFLALQTQLEGTENRITVERKHFNEAAQQFNVLRRTFPNVLIAHFMRFREKAYFQADAQAAKAPQVKF